MNKVDDYLPRRLENDFALRSWLRYSKEVFLVLTSELVVLELSGAAEILFKEKRETLVGKNFLDLCTKFGLKFPLSIEPEQILPGQKLVDVETTLSDNHQVFKWEIIRTGEDNYNSSLFIFIGQEITQLRQVEILKEKA